VYEEIENFLNILDNIKIKIADMDHQYIQNKKREETYSDMLLQISGNIDGFTL